MAPGKTVHERRHTKQKRKYADTNVITIMEKV